MCVFAKYSLDGESLAYHLSKRGWNVRLRTENSSGHYQEHRIVKPPRRLACEFIRHVVWDSSTNMTPTDYQRKRVRGGRSYHQLCLQDRAG